MLTVIPKIYSGIFAFVLCFGLCANAHAQSQIINGQNTQGQIILAQNDNGSNLDFSRLFPSVQNKNAAGSNHYNAGTHGFTIDRGPNDILLKFDNSGEVWSLASASGPRGDEFLRNDVGQVMVRITSLGGVTLYSDSSSGGVAAETSGKLREIKSINTCFKGNVQTAVNEIVTRFTSPKVQNIRIEVRGGLPSYLVYDALERAVDGLASVPSRYIPQTHKIIVIKINRAPAPFVVLKGNVIEMGLTPGIGYAGRPSSSAIKYAIIRGR